MMKTFGRRNGQPKLSTSEAARQGRAVRMAIDMLGSTAAMDFLNSFDPALEGRPIDLAVGSDEGLAAVKALLAARDTI
jgi:uncharacterized protein (DUF2384 family)